MPQESLKEVLMRRDRMTEEEATFEIDEARQEIEEMIEEEGLGAVCEAEEIVKDRFGLEPDYLDELLPT